MSIVHPDLSVGRITPLPDGRDIESLRLLVLALERRIKMLEQEVTRLGQNRDGRGVTG